jgi:hypothetical protein
MSVDIVVSDLRRIRRDRPLEWRHTPDGADNHMGWLDAEFEG